MCRIPLAPIPSSICCFQVQAATTAPPTVLINGVATTQTITGTAGVPITFPAGRAPLHSRQAATERCSCPASAVPVGSTMSHALPVSAVTALSTFNWNNPLPGPYVLNFSALDTAGGSQGSNSVTLSVGKSPSVTTITSIVPGSSVFGQSVTATATVNPASGSVNPTGTVQFKLDGVNIGSPATVSSHVATATFPIVASGSHTLNAVYGGDANLASSTGSTGLVIGQANTNTVFISAVNPQPVGTSVLFQVQVTAGVAPGAGTPSGSVQFSRRSDRARHGRVLQSGGIAMFAAPATLNAGPHLITAQYLGDSGFLSSTSSQVTRRRSRRPTPRRLSRRARPRRRPART